jgi:hypothetical protein
MEDVRNFFLARFAPLIIKSICGTSKIERINYDGALEAKKKHGKVIYAFWHGRQLALAHAHRDEGVIIMTSYSKDGELQSRIMGSLGYEIVRGSYGKRGAVEGTIETIRKMKEERRDSAFAVDGPKGPAFEVKEGAVYIAQKTGAPIIPITSSAKCRKILPNWDRYLVPAPFNRFIIVYGKPVSAAPGDDLTAKAQELKAELDRITTEADRLADA